MARSFSVDEWRGITDHLDAHIDDYGLPERRPGSIVFASWNIRKFGDQFDDDTGDPKRSDGAYRLIERFCRRCDFIAIQEIQTSLWGVRNLTQRLNELQPGSNYKMIASDVTGRAPSEFGLAERFAFIYDDNRIKLMDIASDLTLDQTAVLKRVNASVDMVKEQVLAASADTATLSERVLAWFQGFGGFFKGSLPTFIQFIRSPHFVTFKVLGVDDDHSYDIACVNAHLLSGTTVEREREFFALLEWLIGRSKNEQRQDAPITMLLADLNLDFDSSNEARKEAIADHVTSLNRGRLRNAAKVNFPFLDTPPGREPIRTNSRQNETYDHIAFLSRDERLPRGRHNGEAGQHGPDGFDYGMFNFVRLFIDSGGVQNAAGEIDYDKFTHDVSDHMPIWLRLPRPGPDQHLFTVDNA